MSKGKNQHVTPHPNGGWQVKGEGNVRATARTPNPGGGYSNCSWHLPESRIGVGYS